MPRFTRFYRTLQRRFEVPSVYMTAVASFYITSISFACCRAIPYC